MSQVRYQPAVSIDPKRIQLHLQKIPTGTLGLSDNNQPYLIPVNFVWLNHKIYFHGADAGRKHRIIQENQKASFSVYEEDGFTISPVPAHISIGFFSVYMEGEVAFVDDLEEKVLALQALLNKCVPNYYANDIKANMVEKYRSSLDSKTEVYVLTPRFITAKESPSDINDLYFGGRTRLSDSKLEDESDMLLQSGLIQGKQLTINN